VIIFEDIEEDGFDLFIRLAVHDVVPIGVFYFFFADFCVGFRDAFL
jgi:hypothetical protein